MFGSPRRVPSSTWTAVRAAFRVAREMFNRCTIPIRGLDQISSKLYFSEARHYSEPGHFCICLLIGISDRASTGSILTRDKRLLPPLKGKKKKKKKKRKRKKETAEGRKEEEEKENKKKEEEKKINVQHPAFAGRHRPNYYSGGPWFNSGRADGIPCFQRPVVVRGRKHARKRL